MFRNYANQTTILLALTILLGSCGVSDYINRKKIVNATEKAPVKKETQVASVTSSKCEVNELRINRIIKYINRVRSRQHTCGDKTYAPAPAISWNSKLYLAANGHSRDMATHNLFSHTGSDNSSTGTRVTATGYNWKAVAENISGGTDTPEQTIDRWVASPGHCHNLMNPVYSEIGMACIVNRTSEYEIYWTLVLAHFK